LTLGQQVLHLRAGALTLGTQRTKLKQSLSQSNKAPAGNRRDYRRHVVVQQCRHDAKGLSIFPRSTRETAFTFLKLEKNANN
jgi:hypothetical protein